ncbi:MAG: acyltransferase [Silvibacterium sp.]
MATEVLGRRRATASTGRFYSPGLDALRFFAFLSVFVHHSLSTKISRVEFLGRFGALLPIIKAAAGFGLPLFFFLSSYLITTLLFLEKSRTSTVSLRSFYTRRILRIWPLYFLYISIICMVGFRIPLAHIGWKRMLAMSLLCANWYSIAAGMGSGFIGHLWSISVEEQFYLVWPGITKRLNKQGFLLFISVIGVLSLAITFELASAGKSTLSLWLNSDVEGIFFASGALLALTMPAVLRKSALSSAVMIGFGIVTWLAAEAVGGIQVDGPASNPLLITAGYLMVAAGCYLLLAGALKMPEKRIPKWMIYLGRISYGLYVFHAIFLIIARDYFGKYLRHLPGASMLISMICTVLVATLSYRFLERPFLHLKERFEVVRSRPI